MDSFKILLLLISIASISAQTKYTSYTEWATACTGGTTPVVPTTLTDCSNKTFFGFRCCMVTATAKSCFALPEATAVAYLAIPNQTTYSCGATIVQTAEEIAAAKAITDATVACTGVDKATATAVTCHAKTVANLQCCLLENQSNVPKQCYPLDPTAAIAGLASVAAAKAANPSSTLAARCEGFWPTGLKWYDNVSAKQTCDNGVADASKETNCHAIKFGSNWCCQRTDTVSKKQMCLWYTDAEAKANVLLTDKQTTYSWKCNSIFLRGVTLIMVALMFLLGF